MERLARTLARALPRGLLPSVMLVLPAIDLSGGACVRRDAGRVQPEPQFFADPVRMAKLWRVMNAKVLHLADIDAANGAAPPAADVVAAVTGALDIPVQVGGGITTAAAAGAMLAAGAARVVVEPGTPLDVVAEAVAQFGAGRIVPSVGHPDTLVGDALALASTGVRRLVCLPDGFEPSPEGPSLAAYRSVAEALIDAGRRVRITAAGGVGGYRDLLALQSLGPLGVDSVVVGRALYEGRFPCQQFWCWHRKETVNLDTFSTAPLAPPC